MRTGSSIFSTGAGGNEFLLGVLFILTELGDERTGVRIVVVGRHRDPRGTARASSSSTTSTPSSVSQR
jgi:hypothetical protein